MILSIPNHILAHCAMLNLTFSVIFEHRVYVL